MDKCRWWVTTGNKNEDARILWKSCVEDEENEERSNYSKTQIVRDLSCWAHFAVGKAHMRCSATNHENKRGNWCPSKERFNVTMGWQKKDKRIKRKGHGCELGRKRIQQNLLEMIAKTQNEKGDKKHILHMPSTACVFEKSNTKMKQQKKKKSQSWQSALKCFGRALLSLNWRVLKPWTCKKMCIKEPLCDIVCSVFRQCEDAVDSVLGDK